MKNGTFNVVNLHLTEKCNYSCKYCFARFGANKEISFEEAKAVVNNIEKYYRENGINDGRINLAGGEPLLLSYFYELVDYIADKGIAVSIITNGSLLTEETVRRLRGKVSMIGFSIDSLNAETNRAIGRCNGRGTTFELPKITAIAKAIIDNGIKLKVNTVISKLNINEDMSALYAAVPIDRIKLLQMRVNAGVNDGAADYAVMDDEFNAYCQRVGQPNAVTEADQDIDGAYVIVDPQGNLVSNKGNQHTIVGNCVTEPFGELLKKAKLNYEKFSERYEEKPAKNIFAESVKSREKTAYTELSNKSKRRITQMQTQFYQVTAKCGHVGKAQYYMGIFYVRAEDGSAAAAIVRQKPRVKHDHKDAILAVVKIGYAEFKVGQATYRANPYFGCRNIQEQRLYIAEIADDIYCETRRDKPERHGQDDRKAKLEVLRRFYRKMVKHGYNNYDIGA